MNAFNNQSVEVTELVGTEPDVLPPGVYVGTLARIEQRQTQYGPGLAWLFAVPGVAADGGDVELRGWTNVTTHKGTKAGAWLEAMTGRRLAKGEPLPVRDLTGISVQLIVKLDDSGFNRIEGLLPVPARKSTEPEDPDEAAAFAAFISQRQAAAEQDGADDDPA